MLHFTYLSTFVESWRNFPVKYFERTERSNEVDISELSIDEAAPKRIEKNLGPEFLNTFALQT